MSQSTSRKCRLLVVIATATLVLSACGGDRSSPPSQPTVIPTVNSTASASPPPPPQQTGTPVPFNLTTSRTFDILGWDSWPSAPTPSAVQLRWNAATGKYEVLAPGYKDWGRLEALQDLQFGGPPHKYDAFGSGGAILPFFLLLSAPPHRPPADGYVGNAQIHENSSVRSYFAFGIATAPDDVPVDGTIRCFFGEDEIGEGELTFNRAAGTVSGWAKPFWGSGVVHELVQTSVAPRATSFAARFGTDGVLDGRFFGPRGGNVAVRAKGGGERFADVTGIMTGVCSPLNW